MPGQIAFETRETLLDRLLAGRREIVFLVGAPLTAPERGSTLGVPDVKAMVQRIRGLLQRSGAPRVLRRFDEITKNEATAYQDAFRFLAATLGQDDANAVIRGAVVEAFRPDARPAALPDETGCARLEKQLDEWHYRPGVAAIGQLAARLPERFGGTILTTNFDPLIELSIRRAGGRAHSSFFPRDGSIEQTRGEGCHVVHLHGSWYGADTLHVPAQLGGDRPLLQASLARLLQHRTVVVMAYGGWDDIFTRTLREVSADPGAASDVLWCFYDADHGKLRGTNDALLEQLRPSLGGRTILYAGIDCHAFLPEVVAEVGGASMASAGSYAEMAPVMDDADFAGRAGQRNELLAAFERGQAVQLIGPRRMGKSSLLRWMERKARELGKPAAFVNARGLAGRSPADLVMAAAEALGKRELVRELLYAQRAVPDALDAARAVEKLGQVVLLVDEADALAEKDHGFDRGFFDTLRALGQGGKLQWVSASEGDLFDLFVTTGLTSAFLNDARKIHVGAMARAEAEAFLREYVKDTFRVGWAWEVAGGLLPALKWLGPKLAARDAEPGAVEKGLGVWIKPLFQQWWGRLGEGEREVLKKAVGEGVMLTNLPSVDEALVELGRLAEQENNDEEQRTAVVKEWHTERALARSGFLVEVDGQKLVLGGEGVERFCT